jgi:hypothetical protein
MGKVGLNVQILESLRSEGKQLICLLATKQIHREIMGNTIIEKPFSSL